MSFVDDLNKGLNKKKQAPTKSYTREYELLKRQEEEERKKQEEAEKNNTWFKAGGFSDGVDSVGDFFGDLGETILGTAADVGLGVAKGFTRLAEGVVDLGAYGVAGVADLFGADDWADELKYATKVSQTDMLFGSASNYVDQYSVLGNKSDMVTEGLGQVGGIILTGGLGELSGLSTLGQTLLTTGVMGASGIGSGMTEAYNAGATDGEAFAYGLIAGVADAATELMFGGLSKASKALGIGKGLLSLDDGLAKMVSNKIANQFLKNVTELGIKATAEGVEELAAGFLQGFGKWVTYSDKDFGEILADEQLLDQFIVGAVTSGIAQSSGVIQSKQSRTDFKTKDYITGLTQNEQSVVDKVYNDALNEAKKNGETLTKKQQGDLYNTIIDNLEHGQLNIDDIESVLGGDAYKAYKDTVDSEESLKTELKELQQMESGKMNDFQTTRMNELKGMNLTDTTKRDNLRKQLDDTLSPLLENSKLAETYREKARKGEAFQADLSQYDEKQRAAVERAINSGVLNDTYKAHVLVDTLSKIEADKGIIFDYADNAKLKESGFAIEGVTINGFENNGTVTLNIQSAKAWQSVVGHEITHVLQDNTTAYADLQKALFAYAESRGELQSRRAALTKLYNGMNANIDAELTADLVGDYLFTDSGFIKDLTSNKSLFRKIYDEIKYLYKVATGKQLTEIEKVKREFDKAWKELNVESKTETDSTKDVRLSISNDNAIPTDSNGNELSLAVQKRFANSKAVDVNGNLKVLYHGTASGEFYTFDKAKGSVEGDFGSGFYFTDNEYDVSDNYEGGGADFENKVARRAEQIEAEEDIDYSEAEKRAREELYKGSFKHTVYLNIENPAIVGETNLFDPDEYFAEYDREDYDSDEDYEADVEQLIADDIDKIIWDIEKNVDVYSTDGLAEVLWNAVNEGGIDIEQLKANINNLYLEDSNGNLVGNEVTRQIIESLGYDGIIDNTVSTKFNMNLEEGTTHYIVFKPNQIKSIDNQNPTDNPDIRYSLSEDAIDNGQDLVYNGIRGEGYAQTDEFRNLQAECQGMSDEDIQLYRSGNKQLDEKLRTNIAGVLRTQIESYRNGLRNDDGILSLTNKGYEFNMCKSVDGSLFHDVFEIAQKYLRNGELVDLHKPETTEEHGIGYNYCYNYLSEDGLSGFSITPDGDLISVFNASGKGGFLGAIAPFVKANAKTLDCYNSPNQPLCSMYEKMFGFKAASIMDYNMEFDHDNIAVNHNYPKVAFMVNTESDIETRSFTKDEYEKAVAYRNSFVNQAVGNTAASFVSEDIAPVKKSLSFTGEKPSSVGTPLKDLYYGKDVALTEDIASTQETVPTKTVGKQKLSYADDIAPVTEEEAVAINKENFEHLTDDDAPPEVVQHNDSLPDSISIDNKSLKQLSKTISDDLYIKKKASRNELEQVIQDFSRGKFTTKEELYSEIERRFGTLQIEERREDVAEAKSIIKDIPLYVSPQTKGDFGSGKDGYTAFMRKNFGKLKFSKSGLSADQIYQAMQETHPHLFPSDIWNEADQLRRIAEVANMPVNDIIPEALDEETIKKATDFIYDSVREYQETERLSASLEMLDAPIDTSLMPPADDSIDYSAQMAEKVPFPDEIAPMTEAEANAIQDEKAKSDAKAEGQPNSRKQLHHTIIDNIKSVFKGKGFDFDKVLKKAKNLSTFRTVDNTPQRVMEKALGYKEGQVLADLTVNKVAQNETEGIKWLNSFTDRKNGVLAQISKQYNIKPGSKESAAAQMYAEGFYVDDNNDIVAYGDAELAQDFPNATVRGNIKGLANDPRIRQIYDETLAAINESRTRNAYPEIKPLDNYFLHFRAMDDTFSRLGLPFNPNDIRAKDLPTDLNGVTADLKPGQPYFASAMHRKGKRTSFDLLGGLERYLTSAKNQIYHIDDIQTLRAIRNYIADTYGQASGLEGIDALTEEEAQERIEQVYGSHLSTFAKFLNEEANVLAGKTALIDRGLEGIIGRRGITFLDTINKQVGSNMVGFNVSSSLTNFIPVAQTFAKSNKADFVKAFAQTVSNKLGSIVGKSDGFAESSPVIIRRKGADRFYRTPFQKVADTGYVLMGAVDNISTELIARTKFNELTRKGMSEQEAHFETDKWVSRLMGDRSLGQMPQLYNSKMLGLVTKFQLEVRNQLDSQFYDTIQEAKASSEDIENGLAKNAKTAAKVASTFVQLAVVQHLFGKAFESIAGYNPAFDIIEVLATALGFDDEEDSEDTALDNLEQGFLALLEDLPYTSSFTGGGRIPISSALPITELIKGEDEYGNDKSRLETLKEIAPYYFLPGGYGQIKKTSQGLGMFSDEHPIAGSYTDSGNLRFPVEDTLGNRIQAGIFGQYANENAREYFDNGYAPLKEKQIQEYIDVDMPIKDYWEYRKGLAKQETLEDKFDYIAGLDLSVEQKNILINNVVNRKEEVDLENYDDFSSLEEFDYATKNPDKYAVSKAVGGYSSYKTYSSALYGIKADKDENGKTINGSRKEKVIAWLNELDADYETKIILFKSEYPADDTYNEDIINYINSRDDLTYDERVAIYTELGFTVKDGYVYWN